MRKIVVTLCIISILALVGCATHIHVIGDGPQEYEMVEARQWYVLWGLIPLNEVDTVQLSGGAANYEIKTEQNALDVIINIFTSVVTVYSRTVTVTK